MVQSLEVISVHNCKIKLRPPYYQIKKYMCVHTSMRREVRLTQHERIMS